MLFDEGHDRVVQYQTLCAVDKAWDPVGEAWTKHVGTGCRPGELTDLICHDADGDGARLRGRKPRLWRVEPELRWEELRLLLQELRPCKEFDLCWAGYYPLGRTAKYWLKKILSTSKEWQQFQPVANAWQSEDEGSF